MRPPNRLRAGLSALAVAVLLIVSSPVGALPDGPSRFPPEIDDVRRDYLETILAPVSRLADFSPTVEESFTSGRRVSIGTDANEAFRYIFFVPELDGAFPLSSAGTYIVRRRRSDGAIDQLKIFIRSDPGFFVRIHPGAGRATMSVFIAGVELHRSIPLPISIENLLAEPFSRIVELTERRVDWGIIYPRTDSADYRDVALMASRARSMLHTLPDADDGAMDASGNLVFIESLVLQDQEPGFNCSGFAKWIVDGLHMGLYGSFLAIEPLKVKHLDLRGHRWSDVLEDERDPYFGLDWTRNLATTMLSAGQGGREVHPEAADVRNVKYHTYVEDVGYPVERLAQIMYLLAVEEPGNFYIASLNREFGDDPPLHQHVHVAVLFPYLDESGQFVVNVLERNVETSVESLNRRYRNDDIHLVRVRADQAYTPPVIRN